MAYNGRVCRCKHLGARLVKVLLCFVVIASAIILCCHRSIVYAHKCVRCSRTNYRQIFELPIPFSNRRRLTFQTRSWLNPYDNHRLVQFLDPRGSCEHYWILYSTEESSIAWRTSGEPDYSITGDIDDRCWNMLEDDIGSASVISEMIERSLRERRYALKEWLQLECGVCAD